MSSQVRHLYRFDDFLLDAGERVLLRGGELVALTPKAFETLLALVENSGRIMEKEELLKRIWPDTFVEEATLAQNVFTLRKALGRGQPDEHRYIETIPRRGYRFAAGVQVIREAEPDATATGELAIPSVGDERETAAGLNSVEARSASNGGGGALDAHSQATDTNGQAHAAALATQAAYATASHGDERTASEIRSARRGAFVIATLVILAAVGVILGLFKFIVRRDAAQPPAAASFQSMRVTRLAINGRVEEAILSPDARYVAYVANDAGRRSIWLRQVSTGGNAQQILPAGEFNYAGLTFSRDGERIYYVTWKEDDQPASLYQVPTFGGASKKLTAHLNSRVTLSPDGRRMSFLRVDVRKPQPETELIVADADGGNERTLARRVYPEYFGEPAWSPDGRVIVCPAKSSEPSPGYATLVEIALADGKERALTARKWQDIGQVTWLEDGSGLVLCAAEQELAPTQIWLLSYPGGDVRRVTNDLNSYAGASLSTDATTLLTMQTDLVSNIWVAPSTESVRASRITQGAGKYDGYYGLAWTPDGNRIVYASIASGSWDIWTMNADGGDQKQLTLDARSNYGPSVSPDGRHIVFISNRTGGAFNVWRMDIDGGNPKQLTMGAGENFAHVTPDGKWVVYASVGFGQPNRVWKVPFDGGEPVRLTEKNSSWPFVSPDGRHFICAFQDAPGKPYVLALLPIDGGQPSKMFPLSPTARMNTVWMPDGRGVSYVDNRDGINNIWLQPLDGGAPRQLTDFKSEGVLAYDWSHDGKRLACSRGLETTSVVLIKNFR